MVKIINFYRDVLQKEQVTHKVCFILFYSQFFFYKFVSLKYSRMNSIQRLNKIKDQIKDLEKGTTLLLNENRMANAIEISLLKKQCTELYEMIIKLDVKVEDNIAVSKLPTEVDKPLSHIDMTEPVVEVISKPILVEEEQTPVQPIPEAIQELVKKDEIIQEEKIEPSLFSETTIVIEKKSNLINIPYSEPSLHQKISEHKQADVNEMINESRVESLKSAIGLNKKIAFVNELFKENTVEYAKAIDKLNSSKDLHEAMSYFNELKHQYSWNNENEHTNDLEQLIQKRFR